MLKFNQLNKKIIETNKKEKSIYSNQIDVKNVASHHKGAANQYNCNVWAINVCGFQEEAVKTVQTQTNYYIKIRLYLPFS